MKLAVLAGQLSGISAMTGVDTVGDMTGDGTKWQCWFPDVGCPHVRGSSRWVVLDELEETGNYFDWPLTTDAGRNVPIAMMSAYFINFLFSMPVVMYVHHFPMALSTNLRSYNSTLCFAMPDLDAALQRPNRVPCDLCSQTDQVYPVGDGIHICYNRHTVLF
jgi:hypothetical protein